MKIVVVGGGSSGWLTAAGLIRTFPNYEICVVESKTIPTIGVGESTTTVVNLFIRDILGIDENEFLRNVDGIYKMAVRFNNFSRTGETYYYPFGLPVVRPDIKMLSWDIVQYCNKHLTNEDMLKLTFPAAHLFLANKIDKNKNNEFNGFDFQKHLGYHFDANKVGAYLRDSYCIPRKVKLIQANVVDVNFMDNKVESLTLDDGSKLTGDLFVDCTGYRSILLGQKMKPKFIDISHKLFNNRAWATPIKYRDKYKEMQPYTTATAIENGWCWYTPIGSRIGNGYAYSDKYVTPEKALDEFKNYILNSNNYSLTKQEVDELPFFQVPMKTGFYEESMVKNVVAIGLSSGFLEPLEGTGLHFIIWELFTLFRIIEKGLPNQFLIDTFNLSIKKMYQTWTDGLTSVYLFSGKTDTEYWKDIFNLKTTDLNLLAQPHYSGLHESSNRILSWEGHNHTYDLFNATLRGTGFINQINDVDIISTSRGVSFHHQPYSWASDIHKESQEILRVFMKNKAQWELNAQKALHIYDFLKQNNAIKE